MSKIFYAASTGGFYSDAIHGKSKPADAVEITTEKHAELLAAQGEGKRITAGAGGYPVALDRPALTSNQMIIQQIAALESTVTQRRIREAALGTDGGWLLALDGQIAALRANLTQ